MTQITRSFKDLATFFSAGKSSGAGSPRFRPHESSNAAGSDGSNRPHTHALTAIALAMVLAAFVSDWRTGTELASSLFYMTAIMFGSWFVGRGTGIFLALLSFVAWITAYYLVGEPFSKPSVLYWNLFGELSVYIITALAVAQAKAGLEQAHDLAARLGQANLALDREMQAVGNLQREMLPQAPPGIDGYQWETFYLTSTQAGGDYYDFFPSPGGRIGIVVADASGHGAPAAVLMAMLRMLLHSGSGTLDPPDRVLSRLNGQLAGTMPEGLFVTACFAVLDPASSRLEYSLAGHDAPILIRAADGAALRLDDRGGVPLGLFSEAAYQSGSTILEPGDTLVMHTDGLTEAMSPTEDLFGNERLLAALSESRTFEPADIRTHLLARLDAHRMGIPLSDDLTLVILRRLKAVLGGPA